MAYIDYNVTGKERGLYEVAEGAQDFALSKKCSDFCTRFFWRRVDGGTEYKKDACSVSLFLHGRIRNLSGQ
jgi:hypothetical protein